MSRIIPDGFQWYVVEFAYTSECNREVYIMLANSPEQALVRVGNVHDLWMSKMSQPFTVALYPDQDTLNTIISGLPEQAVDYQKIVDDGKIVEVWYPTHSLYFHETMNYGMNLQLERVNRSSHTVGYKYGRWVSVRGTGFPTLDTWTWNSDTLMTEWDEVNIREAINTYISNRNN